MLIYEVEKLRVLDLNQSGLGRPFTTFLLFEVVFKHRRRSVL